MMIKLTTFFLLMSVCLDAVPVPGVTGGGSQGRRTRTFTPPAPGGTAPTLQVTHEPDHYPPTSSWVLDTGIDYYVATTGTSGGAGTIGDPWDLTSVLDGSKDGTLAAGDVIAVRGGTFIYPTRGSGEGGYTFVLQSDGTPPADWATSTSYTIGDKVRKDQYSPYFYTCNTNHTSGSTTLDDDITNWDFQPVPDHHILMRNYNGEHVKIDGGIEGGGTDYATGPHYVTLWGMEIYAQEFLDENTSQGKGDRYLAEQGSNPGTLWHGGFGWDVENGEEFYGIHNYVHALRDGSFGGTNHRGGLYYGNVFYDCGWWSDDRYHGVGTYARNGDIGTSSGLLQRVHRNEMYVDIYSNPYQAYGSGGVAMEALVSQEAFARDLYGSGRSNYQHGGSRINYYEPDWLIEKSVVFDCRFVVGITEHTVQGATVQDNYVISKPGGANRGFEFQTFTPLVTSNNTDDPAAGKYVFLNPSMYEYGTAHLNIIQTDNIVSTILVDDFEKFMQAGDQWAVYDIENDSLHSNPLQTGAFAGGDVFVGIDTADKESFYAVVKVTALAP